MIAGNAKEKIAARLDRVFTVLGYEDKRGRTGRIAADFKVFRESVRKWLAGESIPETWRLAEIAKLVPGLTVDQILTGREFDNTLGPTSEYWLNYQSDTGNDISEASTEPVRFKAKPSYVPIVGNTQGGPDVEWVENGYPAGYSDEYLNTPSNDINAYGLRVRGSSMSPRIRDGAALLIHPNDEPMPGDDVVVRLVDGDVMVKELVYWRNGEVAFDSLNEAFARKVVPETEIVFLHRVHAIFPSSSIIQSID